MGSSPYSRAASNSKPSWDRKSKQNTKFGRNFGKFEPKKFSLGLMGFCSLMLLTFFSVSKLFHPSTPLSENDEAVPFIESAPNGKLEEEIANLGSKFEDIGSRNNTTRNESRKLEELSASNETDSTELGYVSFSVFTDLETRKQKIENNVNLKVDSVNELAVIVSKDEGTPMIDKGVPLEDNLNMELHSSDKQDVVTSNIGDEIEVESTEIKSTLTCDENSIDEGFPYARPAICEMTGEITINPVSSLVTIISSPDQGYGEKKIRPYARKDDYLFPKVKEITLKSVFTESDVPHCTITHEAPAVLFSVSGYTGNFFHDMADVLIPLFLTSYQFNGEVQFFVTNYDHKWIQKYRPILGKLSRYSIVNLDRDKSVHCVKHAFLGLFRDRDLIIHLHPTRNPKNYDMLDFTKFLRQVYGLKRGAPIVLGDQLHKRPRMLIISRKGTRRISNLRELVRVSKQLGFEVVVSEAGGNVKRYAQLVNSCDVMLAVHGAGLTNQIFLPPNAVVIQVVPWGKMDWMATNFYGQPAIEMNLKYLEYSVSMDESSLIERYPRDHVVFKDPYSIHLQGWEALSNVIMAQNVKLNLRRFRETLLSALDLLQE
ncbi:hypothetical protein LUZ62_075777 [Rhynchospora pubera]|uniref:Glycosyltransferase 61 catalytic domain-containing protein n=1 Tax=Rhynchospora pubera TaxID=906938 RepID=A0AAV8DFL6_9POAL|nr:hypothetical protein LUZ62_075777 [Rhynchospora pubera]